MNRDPVKEPKIGDTWKQKDSNYEVTIVKITPYYIECKANDDSTHDFGHDWFSQNIKLKYNFTGQSIILLQQRIIEKQKELNELIEELCKLTSQN